MTKIRESSSLGVVLDVLRGCRPGYWISVKGVANRCKLSRCHVRNLLNEAAALGYAETTFEIRTESRVAKRQLWRSSFPSSLIVYLV